jgi:hypothetical protein
MRVFQYGLRKPIAGEEALREQLLLAHRYYNKLVEIERTRRAAVRAFEDAETRAKLEDAAEATRVAAVAVKAHRAKHRERKVPTALLDALHEARAAEKLARVALRDARARLRGMADYQDRVAAIEDRNVEEVKAARAACGVYSGTYQLIESAVGQARSDTPLWDGAEPNDVGFQRYTGEGAVSVQIVWQNGDPPPVTSEMMMAGMGRHAFFTAGEDDRGDSNRRRLKRRMNLHMRVNSDDKGKPVWVVFPIVLHRPLPVCGAIKRVTVHSWRVGPKWHRSVDISVQEIQREAPTCGKGVVAVDLGWRQTEGALRVGVWKDLEGATEPIFLADTTEQRLRKPESLRSIRDKNLDAMKLVLVELLRNVALPRWLLLRTVKRNEAPPTNAQACAYLLGWRSPGRFAALVRHWAENRFDGDAKVYTMLEAWRYRDHHLWTWESNQREGSLNRRREEYRLLANRLARRYDTLILADVDISKVAKRAETHEEEGDNEQACSNRHLVAASELRNALINVFLRRGGYVVVPVHEKVAGKRLEAFERAGILPFIVENLPDKTRTCHECGAFVDFDRARFLWADCACGASWDQDDNAAENMLAAYRDNRESVGAAIGAEASRRAGNTSDYGGVRETRFQKASRQKAEKKAQEEAARKELDNAAE